MELFPDVVDITAEFVKQHGFAAHRRRRTETGYSSGVSIRDLRTHLLGNVKGLQEHRISLSTVRRLFEPPNKGRNSLFNSQEIIEESEESEQNILLTSLANHKTTAAKLVFSLLFISHN